MFQLVVAESDTGNIRVICLNSRTNPIKRKRPIEYWQEGPLNMAQDEESLWKAVIMQAMVDATILKPRLGEAGKKRDAMRWLLEDNDDFRDVCLRAGLDCHLVRVQAKKAMANPGAWRIAAGESLRYCERRAMRARMRLRRRELQEAEEHPPLHSAAIIPFSSPRYSAAMEDKRYTLHRIFNRLCFVHGVSLLDMDERREQFIGRLLDYPEDLICAAYKHLQQSVSERRCPDEHDFIQFMQPEFMRRRQVACAEREGA